MSSHPRHRQTTYPAARAAKEGIHRTSICRINFYKIIHVYIGLSGGRFEITYDILNSMVILCGNIKCKSLNILQNVS